jgi:hypothetical protein
VRESGVSFSLRGVGLGAHAKTKSAQAEEPVWEAPKIDFHIPFQFLFLLKRFKLFASTKIQSMEIGVATQALKPTPLSIYSC